MKRIIISILLAIPLMMAFSGQRENSELLPTSLNVKVLDYLGNIVEGAAVRLFHTEEDYRNETNQVGETQYTDKKGKTSFKNLESRIYFLYVTKDDLNNVGGGVQTDTLKSGKVNKINIVIE
jgi:hypothetical protein